MSHRDGRPGAGYVPVSLSNSGPARTRAPGPVRRPASAAFRPGPADRKRASDSDRRTRWGRLGRVRDSSGHPPLLRLPLALQDKLGHLPCHRPRPHRRRHPLPPHRHRFGQCALPPVSRAEGHRDGSRPSLDPSILLLFDVMRNFGSESAGCWDSVSRFSHNVCPVHSGAPLRGRQRAAAAVIGVRRSHSSGRRRRTTSRPSTHSLLPGTQPVTRGRKTAS